MTDFSKGYLQTSVGNGTRSSSATAYLDPLRHERSNLDVLIQTQATKLVATDNSSRQLEFTAVELANTNSSFRVSVTASKEIILSAGVIGTPKLLQLSGIGPAGQLKQLGIAPLIDLPDVGSHLIDQPFLPLYWNVSSNQTWDSYLRNTTIQMEDLAEWKSIHQGLLAGASSGTVSYVRLPANASIFKAVPDPSAGLQSGHVEMLYGVR